MPPPAARGEEVEGASSPGVVASAPVAPADHGPRRGPDQGTRLRAGRRLARRRTAGPSRPTAAASCTTAARTTGSARTRTRRTRPPRRRSLGRIDAVGISCYSSKDLLRWKHEGVVLAGGQGRPEARPPPVRRHRAAEGRLQREDEEVRDVAARRQRRLQEGERRRGRGRPADRTLPLPRQRASRRRREPRHDALPGRRREGLPRLLVGVERHDARVAPLRRLPEAGRQGGADLRGAVPRGAGRLQAEGPLLHRDVRAAPAGTRTAPSTRPPRRSPAPGRSRATRSSGRTPSGRTSGRARSSCRWPGSATRSS